MCVICEFWLTKRYWTLSYGNIEKEKKRRPENIFDYIHRICVDMELCIRFCISIGEMGGTLCFDFDNSFEFVCDFQSFLQLKVKKIDTDLHCNNCDNLNLFYQSFWCRFSADFLRLWKILFENEMAYLHGLHHWFCWSKPNLARHFFILLPKYHHWCKAIDGECWRENKQTIFLALDQ